MSSLRVFICAVFSFLQAATLAQSNLLITAKYEGVTLAFVLSDLSKKADLVFAFDSYELAQYSGSWNFKDVNLEQVLRIILEPEGFSYKWIDHTIIVFPFENLPKSNEVIAPEPTWIRGEVRDIISRELLPFSALSLRRANVTFTADENGKFQFEASVDGQDTLSVFFVGYETKTLPLKSLSNKNFSIIYLTAARNYLPDVFIQADGVKSIEVNAAPSLSVLNPGEIAARHGIGEADVFRTAQILPGVSGLQESNNGLFLRGSNSDQTLIALDGFTLYHQDHFFGTFTAVSANAIKSMRIHKGAPEARLGGRTAGVLEMIGKEGNLKRPGVQLDFGTLSAGAAIEAPIDTAGKASVFICARRSITDVLFSPAYKELFNTVYNGAITTSSNNATQTFGMQNDPQFYFQDANVKFTIRPSSKNYMNVSLYASKDQLFVQYADTSNSEIVNKNDILYSDESIKKNTGGSIRLGHQINNRWQSVALIGLSRFQGTFFSADTITEFSADSVRFNNEITSLDDLNARLDFLGSFSKHQLNIGLQWNAISTADKLNNQGIIERNNTNHGNVYTVYVEDEFQLGKRLFFTPGCRLNFFDRDEKLYTEPRFQSRYFISENLNLKFSAGRTNQFVQRIQTQSLYQNTPDYWEVAGDQDIHVMTCDQICGGFLFKKKGWILDLEIFDKWKKGSAYRPGPYAQFEDPLGNYSTTLTGSGRAYGLDVFIQKNHKRQQASISYSWMKAYSDFSELNQFRVPEVFAQTHEIKLNYEINFKRWDFSLLWVFGSGRPYTPLLGSYLFPMPDGTQRRLPVFGDINSARLPAYHRLDIMIGYRTMLASTEMKIFASVYNVYNQTNFRDMQYLTVRSQSNPYDFATAKRALQMIGILPTLNLTLKF